MRIAYCGGFLWRRRIQAPSRQMPQVSSSVALTSNIAVCCARWGRSKAEIGMSGMVVTVVLY